MSASRRIVFCVPSLRMREREPLHKLLHIPILARIDDKMKMIRHQAICKHAHVVFLTCVFENPLKHFKIILFKENRQTSIRAIQDVVWVIADIDAWFPSHRQSLTCRKWYLTPFSLYLRDDAVALQYEAMKAELQQIQSRLRQLRFGDVQDEVNALGKKANELSEKLEFLRTSCAMRLE